MKDYYEYWLPKYMMADKATREASKKHWIKCHKENLKAKREDLIIFSAKMLATITLADELLDTVTLKEA